MQTVRIEGMSCDSCARHVESALRKAGAHEAEVDWRHGQARVTGGELGEAELADALEGTDYRLVEVGRSDVAAAGIGRSREHDYGLIVIGSGGAAFAAAIRARDLEARVLLIERETIGGTCVNVGCIPSKSLLVDAERSETTGEPSFAAALARKAGLVERLRQEKYIDLLDAYGIELLEAEAELTGPHTVSADGQELSAGAILIATGARPAVPAIEGLEEAGYLTSTTALELSDPPRRLAVIGANAVGLELGVALAGFGSELTFLARRRVAPFGEPEISEAMRGILEDEGHLVIERALTERVSLDGGEKVLRGTADGSAYEIRVDEILVAASRRPNTEGLGLERVGVERDEHGAVLVGEEQRTSIGSIFAAGDVTPQPQFVYVAAAAGAAAAENALGEGGKRLDFDSLPRIIFTTPQIAAAGLTEEQAIERGFEVEARVLPLDAIPRALVNGDTRGLYKLVAEAGTGRLLGVSVIADGGAEVIQAAVLAIERGMTVGELGSSWAPYLTMAEGLKLAAQTFTRDVAKLSCCAA